MATTSANPWLDRIAPRARFAWRGRWQTGTVEPWRLLYDHELVLFQQGECRVTVADTPPADAGPLRRDAQGRPLWQAVSGRDAAVLARRPTPGTAHLCPAGSFLIIPPETAHVTLVTRGPVVRTCIHFDWLADDAPPSPLCTVPPEKPDPALVRRAPAWIPAGLVHGEVRLRRAVDDLADAFFRRWNTRRVDERLAGRGTLLELLVRLLADADEAEAPAAHDLAHAVKHRLDQQLTDPRALPDLLADLDRSYEHLCRMFAACYGLPPLRYLTAARVERAKELLVRPGAGIAEVAQTVGYSDPAYFSRLFRAHVGTSPSAYAQQALRGA
jgi:AraC-like DNA-binding protein